MDCRHVDSSVLGGDAAAPVATVRLSLAHVSCEALIQRDLIQSFISGGCNSSSEHVDEVSLLNDIAVSHLIVAGQEDVKLALLHAILGKAKPLQARVLEVFLRAVALSLREYAKHQLDLTVKWRKFSCNLHDDILLELFTIDKVSCSLVE